MIRKRAFLVLAVGVLMGTMAVIGFADDQWMDTYGAGGDSYGSSQPEPIMNHSNAGEIREPVETGAVPDPTVSSSDLNCCTNGTDPTFWMGGP